MSKSGDAHVTLGGFLRARRAELSPDQVGIPGDLRIRKVPGLRREEVAGLAAISTDYYTRLEQGRVPVSENIILVLARALRLNHEQERYLREIARPAISEPRKPSTQVSAPTQQLLDDLVFSPALVLGRHMDILAWNGAAAALFTDFAAMPHSRRNYILLAFLDPQVRALYADWENDARLCVSFLRRDAARYPDDPRLHEIVEEASVADRYFRTWWNAHQVADSSHGTKSFHHPLAGTITLDWQMFGVADASDQTMTVLSAPVDTPSRSALEELIVAAGSVQRSNAQDLWIGSARGRGGRTFPNDPLMVTE